jgi:hypothetical protein
VSGVLQITEQPRATWLPQTRVFDYALRAVADELRDDPELADRLATAGNRGTAYADIRELEPDRFRALVDATGRAVNAELARGPAPDSAVRVVRYGMSLLRALLAADPRATDSAGDGSLALGDGVVWRAPGDAARLAREHLAAAPGGDPAALDLQAAVGPRFAAALEAGDWMAARYAPEANLEADAEATLDTLHPPLAALAELLHADPRAAPA